LVQIKTPEQIKLMREVGKYHAELTASVREFIKVGQSTYEIDQFALKRCKEMDVIPAQIGYKGYKFATCIGVNTDGVHCFPSKDKIIKDGDLVTFDSVIRKNGYHADGGFTVGIGSVDEEAHRLIKTTKKALKAAINACKDGNNVQDVSKALYKVVQRAGFDVLRRYSAHGIGLAMHEDPLIPNYPFEHSGKGIVLKSGMTLALDTMVVEGDGDVITLDNGWETQTNDGGRFCFFEHTVVVTERGGEILTAK
jgi:methionyl aminopeptidase